MSSMRIVALVALLGLAALFVPRLVASRDRTRDIQVVVRGMTYYVDGDSAANPELRLRAGELVRVTLRNEDRGMQHDFGIRAWSANTGIVEYGREGSVVFRVPSRAEDVDYTCTPHSAMMRGHIAIQ